VIQKARTGRGFGGVLRYVLDTSEERGHQGARMVGTTMGGQNAWTLGIEFRAFADLNRGISEPVYHCSLRLAPEERLRDDQWGQIARRFLDGMGFGEHPYVAVLHDKPGGQHIHLIASRVGLDGRAVNLWQDRVRSQGIVRELEREFVLRHAVEHWRDDGQQRDSDRWGWEHMAPGRERTREMAT